MATGLHSAKCTALYTSDAGCGAQGDLQVVSTVQCSGVHSVLQWCTQCNSVGCTVHYNVHTGRSKGRAQEVVHRVYFRMIKLHFIRLCSTTLHYMKVYFTLICYIEPYTVCSPNYATFHNKV